MPHPPDQETKGHAEITIKRHLISHQNHARVITKKKELISIMKKVQKKHTTPGIRWSSPTQLLIQPSMVYVQGSGRDPQLSIGYGRM